jgi:hypothetical protein
LKATPPERAKWVTVGVVSGFAFALAALLVTVTLRLHSYYARKLLQVRVSRSRIFPPFFSTNGAYRG